MTVEIDVPPDLVTFTLPEGVHRRLQELLHRQDSGVALTSEERLEAEGLLDLAEFLSLLKMRARQLPISRAL
jgi:hypothetical protein